MPFDLRQLRFAVATAKLGSYHHAARTCGVSEAAIAEGVAELAALLRLQLFEPVGAAILPTPDGMRFLREAEHLIWRAEQIAALATGTPAGDGTGNTLLGRFEIVGAPCACGDDLVSGSLAAIDDQEPRTIPPVASDPEKAAIGDPTSDYVDLCRSILAARQLMARSFGVDLFADPAGEMLLDLYIREHDGIATSITNIWNPSNVAYGTARRSLAIMERRGLVIRTPDREDRRRTLVLITDVARAQIEACLDVILDRPTHDQTGRSRRAACG
ncbi:regulatory helix-turn-helix protein, lysR family [Sphingomonas laterariae]|uniref:Regulatory helix-turn-helix protein, lysR family n=1 Tax=Edaphosphingomonas laterariae TaxID=861865 RepID=A0A239GIZ2_9SPHN|nr:LysR family transcriptional regulator [Sphingomonas laterariae]SNS69137.1 regulatory helix-turn-helix protein, lysR family [Sphingomonas laterariae]